MSPHGWWCCVNEEGIKNNFPQYIIAPSDLFRCFCISRPVIKRDHVLKTTTELHVQVGRKLHLQGDSEKTIPLEWMMNDERDVSKRKTSVPLEENGEASHCISREKGRAVLWRADLV